MLRNIDILILDFTMYKSMLFQDHRDITKLEDALYFSLSGIKNCLRRRYTISRHWGLCKKKKLVRKQ